MIVCVCRRVSDRQVLNVIQEGAATEEAVERRCGAGGDCGACKKTIEGMITEHAKTGCRLPSGERPDKRAA
ncbi:MAG: (2Fe-2S)-binding protein [Deltaproteobacteria bacterium]